ncbi:hypothetical protein B0H17DRAFT_1137513 [Mycena rosella]|uniref:Uncharacterized protein n=1 Tax=Mycena rosella TaxID=1033263 RepID=A0AAD7D8N0_MYCRO|nr:hypothetical protein B0H17DRAFT_1137513 [Mycena rosella]
MALAAGHDIHSRGCGWGCQRLCYVFALGTSLRAVWRQSTSLEQAAARYVLRNGRPPPRNYQLGWYRFAKRSGCLIHGYEQVRCDFELFYEPARENVLQAHGGPRDADLEPGARLIHSVQANTKDACIAKFKVEDGEVQDEPVAMGRRERRVVEAAEESRIPCAQAGSLKASDAAFFKHAPDVKKRAPRTYGVRHRREALASADFTTDFYPVMSYSEISPSPRVAQTERADGSAAPTTRASRCSIMPAAWPASGSTS